MSDGISTTYALLINDLGDCTEDKIEYEINGGGKMEINLGGNETTKIHQVSVKGNNAKVYKLTEPM